MENASKMLLIAAAILIAIILITLGIKVLGSADDTTKQAQGVGDSLSLATKDSTSKLESLLNGLAGGPSSLNHSGTIPEGEIYISNGTTYNAGDTMPSPKGGDTYIYGDYKYTFNTLYMWSVKVIDKSKPSYEEIIKIINEKDIKSMHRTFEGCTSLTKAPVIPDNVTNISYTFEGCTSLEKAPIIPKGVKDIHGTFRDCTSLTKAPIIPDTVQNMEQTFYNCTKLEKVTTIPKSVIIMRNTFDGCTSLEGEININANPVSYTDCFNRTIKPIIITGDSIKKAELAATSRIGNLTY